MGIKDFFFKNNKNIIKPIVLLSLDGYGIAPPSDGNAITKAKTPNMDRITAQYPHGELIAAGESVGLPANEAGNSEVGHLAMGVGRQVLQSLMKINKEIEEGMFFDNKAFIAAASHVKKHNSKLHIMGLASTGEVHSAMNHMYALLQFCKKEELRDVNLHLFTDGRDAPPQNGIEVIKKIEQHLESIKVGRIASITGRYYAMDRDGRWERTQKAYEAIVSGKGLQAFSAVEAVQGAYAKGKTDEFIEPTIILDDTSASKLGPSSAKESVTVNDNDAVIFFNFRVDRPRQLTMAFVFDDFESLSMVEFGYIPHEGKMKEGKAKGPTFKRTKVPRNVYFVTMTEYQKNLPVGAIAYPPPTISNTLPEILSQRGMLQMHLAESEKERMVTFYFDGLKDERFPGEDVEIIPSPDVPTYDKKPEMSVYKIVKSFKRHIKRNKYHFFMLNFANPDMVAHSGNLEATIKAVEAVDKAVGELVKTVLDVDGTVFITADHGNAEELLTFPSRSYFITTSKGSINTEHSNNPVPLLIVSNAFKGNAVTLPKGALSDIAPTILNMMGIPVPPEMDGKNLLEVQVSGKNKQASNIRKGEESSVLV